MEFGLQRWGTAARALAAIVVMTGGAGAQELGAPAEGLVIRWRSPEVPQMPAVTWTAIGVDGQVTTMRSEARALFDRMVTQSTMYRVLFPVRGTDAFGTVSEFEYDRAAIDTFGRLDPGKTFRVGVKAVSKMTNPQTKQQTQYERASVMIVTVERHETIEVPAGKFATVVVTLEDEGAQATPAIHRVVRRYWYAPAVGWYVRYQIIATGPQLDQVNHYVAAAIIVPEKRTDRR